MGYENGKIYKLICSETGNIYIGSTIHTLNKRIKKHRSEFNYCMSKTFINPIIVLIKDFPCNNKEELEAEEVIFIKEVNCVNKVIPGRTKKEWREDNKDKIKHWRKQYRLDNKEKIKQQVDQYQLDNKVKIKEWQKQKCECECGAKFSNTNKARHFKSKKHLKFISL